MTGGGTPARSSVRASAAVDARIGGDGRTELAVLRSEVPLLLRGRREAAGADPVGSTVYLVGGAAGPLAGDQLALDLRVGPGAALTLRSVAATVALPGRSGMPSRLVITATVAAGGTLTVIPEPTVAAAECRHEISADVALTGGAALLWRDELLLGRYGEEPGSLSMTLRVDVDGVPLVRHQVSVGPGELGSDGPAVLGGARAVGTVLVSGPPWVPAPVNGSVPMGGAAAVNGSVPVGSAPYWAPGVETLPLAGPGLLVTALAADAVELRHRLDAAVAALSPAKIDTGAKVPVLTGAETWPEHSGPVPA